MDAATRRNLELDTSLAGREDATLVGVIDRTATAMGARELRRWVRRPLRERETLRARYGAIAALIQADRYDGLHEILRGIGDVERVLARVALRSARPRDLAALREALDALPRLQAVLVGLDTPLLAAAAADLGPQPVLQDLLRRALVAMPPPLLREGGVIAAGYDAALDELRSIATGADTHLLGLEERERRRTGISQLKVAYNRVHGYYIELPRSQSERAPLDYQRRQTVKNAERFITPELKQFEDKVLGSRDRALARERELFDGLLDSLIAELAPLKRLAAALACIDVLASFAERAVSLRYVMPELTDKPGLLIDGGRHPVVERVLEDPFVPNDLELTDARRMLVITGPNMGGKSTYMRQAALILVLASIGSFVPATRAVIGPFDRIFTRIGASDDLAGGRSTFMVEMTEAAVILNAATDRSLVLMDEIGRGTSTYDGLSLAWACAEPHRAVSACVHAVCDALLRADRARGRDSVSRERPSRRDRARRRHRVPACRETGPRKPQLRAPGRAESRRPAHGHRERARVSPRSWSSSTAARSGACGRGRGRGHSGARACARSGSAAGVSPRTPAAGSRHRAARGHARLRRTSGR